MSIGPAGPVLPRRIVLTGFMGAGKSTVGRMLAARLGWPFLDIDSVIAAEQDRTVAQIFAHHGEPHFRSLEAETVARVLASDHEHSRAVVALGGGAIETEAVRNLLLRPGAIVIFLSAPLDELLARCGGGAETPIRPLLAAAEPPQDRLARRLPHYRQAHLTVDTSGIPPATVVDRILGWLEAYDPPHLER
jgi:shikimate kinase